jgi:anti-anti-sigma factor
MKLKQKGAGGKLVFSLSGEMEPYDADEFEGRALEAIKKGARSVTIDLSRLEYISSSGLRALINIRNSMEKQGGRLVLTQPKGKVLEVFRVSKLLPIFEIADGAPGVP